MGLACSTFALAEGALGFSKAMVRAPIPGTPNTAAFLTIINDSDQPAVLVSASTSVAQRVELHNHIHEDGLMKMRQVSQIEIAAQSSQQLQPGGYHIMLFNVSPLKDGSDVTLTLTFSDGKQYQVTAKVQDMMAHHH